MLFVFVGKETFASWEQNNEKFSQPWHLWNSVQFNLHQKLQLYKVTNCKKLTIILNKIRKSAPLPSRDLLNSSHFSILPLKSFVYIETLNVFRDCQVFFAWRILLHCYGTVFMCGRICEWTGCFARTGALVHKRKLSIFSKEDKSLKGPLI